MDAGYILFPLLFLSIVIVVIVFYNYLSPIKRGPWVCVVWCIFSWIMTLSYICFLPADYNLHLRRECIREERSDCGSYSTFLNNKTAFKIIWNIIYWGNFLNVWVTVPFFQSYYKSGGFTKAQRSLDSIKENIVTYLLMLTAAVVAVIVLLSTKMFTFERLLGVAMALASFLTLSLYVVTLGYGLIDLPRLLWRKGSIKTTKDNHAFRAARYFESLKKESENLAHSTRLVQELIDNYEPDGIHDHYIEDLNTELAMSNELLQGVLGSSSLDQLKIDVLFNPSGADTSRALKQRIENFRRQREIDLGGAEFADLERSITRSQLKTFKKHKKQLRQGRWIVSKSTWSFLNHSNSYNTIVDYNNNATKEVGFQRFLIKTRYNKVTLVLIRSTAVIMFLFSLLIIWGESVMFIQKYDLSPISLLLHAKPLHSWNILFMFIFLFYSAICALSSLIRLRLFNIYRLVPHQSDPPSLFFLACYASMFMSPLCQNALVFLHADKEGQSFYGDVISVMNVIPIIGTYFQLYFPLVILLVAILAFFNLTDRILSCCKFQRFGVDSARNKESIRKGETIIASLSHGGTIESMNLIDFDESYITPTSTPDSTELASFEPEIHRPNLIRAPNSPKRPPKSSFGTSKGESLMSASDKPSSSDNHLDKFSFD
ncbi:putative LMBR1-like membrane protein [Blattamonas nauphoetae]|uniref:LMBR1-like membrane protein n=1 Tax=Blattamonas nauphoetae TaxID=2049346 RepID=A0ABQ9XT70_9EUKA|nr:putative LMBR1-like membrane protein [Blattamonas nauphoetae]